MTRYEIEASRNPTWGTYYYDLYRGRRARVARMERVQAAANAAVMRMIRGREA